MKWKIPETPSEKAARLRGWHLWFAWHPVLLNDNRTFVWLEYVMRRIDTAAVPEKEYKQP